MRVRTQVKAGKIILNHNEGLRVRSAIKAGKIALNHNESLKRQDEAISMRRTLVTTGRKDDRLELLVVRAGLRAGRGRRGRGYAFGFGRK